MHEETEFKLSLSPETAERLLRHKGLRSVGKKRPGRRRLVSTYFDTPRHVLRKSGVTLRVRENGAGAEQTVKAPFAGPAGLQNFREWTAPANGGVPDFSHVDDPSLGRALRLRRCEERLRPVFVTDFEREAVRVRVGATEFELAVDRGVIRAETRNGRVEEPICEAEFELLSGNPARMLDVALELCEAYDARPGHATKAQRGYALARPALRPRPKKAAGVELSAETSVGGAFGSIIGSALEHLFANEAPTLAGEAEGVHQTRVAMRRVRAALRAFKSALPYDKRKAFNGEFRWFQQRLSPARDWQVFLSETLPKIAAAAPVEDAAAGRLRRVARAERRRALGDVAGFLRSRRYARLLLQFERWLASLGNDPGEVFERPVGPFAKTALRKTWRYFLEDSRPLSRLPYGDLHEVRKRGKKARYATQFFSSLWTGPDARPFMKLMARLQDDLGSANDAVAARRVLAAVPPGKLDPAAAGIVADWSRDRVAECVRRAQPRLRNLRRTRPFWEE